MSAVHASSSSVAIAASRDGNQAASGVDVLVAPAMDEVPFSILAGRAPDRKHMNASDRIIMLKV